MRKIIAKKWVKALRSGKYKQGKGYLKQFTSKNEPRHCCLGVLCELYDQQMKKNHKKTLYTEEMEDKSSGTSFVRFDLVDGGLPRAVREWANMINPLGEFIKNDRVQYLADLNDDGKKFSTIADIIEKNVESL
ncbi:MAG: hypothetical protein EBU90_20210 [Proteobacteria bacterium]|nr:hypothetical protein [Pseudomonadota bacterium]NBP16214.1 hypothetical protein [bacterium]